MTKSALLQRAIQQMLDTLEAEGQRILQECVDERTYLHQTHNLYDSYGYGVYYKGKLERKGFLSANPEATVGVEYGNRKDIHGRDEIETALNARKGDGRGFTLTIMAAMPYAEDLETGKTTSGRQFRVISMAYNKLADLAPHYSGSRVVAIK